jgi:hypothetical protein
MNGIHGMWAAYILCAAVFIVTPLPDDRQDPQSESLGSPDRRGTILM